MLLNRKKLLIKAELIKKNSMEPGYLTCHYNINF